MKTDHDHKPMPLAAARRLAERIVAEISPLCLKVEIAGSIRRALPMVNDIDLVCLPFPTGLAELQARFKRSCISVKAGTQNAIYQLANGFQLDVFFAYERNDLISGMTTNWGTLLLCRTGSKDHNIYLVQRAKHLGLIWRPYAGVFRADTGDFVTGGTEEAIFAALRLDFIPPEKRESF